MIRHPQQQSLRSSMIIHGSFFTFCFLYIWFWIQPELLYTNQQPVFLFGTQFFEEFINYPGGLIDYLSAFLTQFYIYSWAGAAILTLTLVSLTLLTRQMFKSFNSSKSLSVIHFIPSIFLLGIYHQYTFPLSISLSLLASLLFYYLYQMAKSKQMWIRLILFFIMFSLLYYLAAGASLLFSVLCIIFEIFKSRYSQKWRLLPILFYIVMTILMPYYFVSYIFLIQTEYSSH